MTDPSLPPEPDLIPRRILLAEGDADFAALALRRLEGVVPRGIQVDTASDGPSFLDRVFSRAYHLVFLDARLPDAAPLTLLERIARTTLPMPVIILTPTPDARLAVDLMRRGAMDVLTKEEFLKMDLPELLKEIGETPSLRRQNAELQQINQMKNDFLATISHELRTPLTSILGLSEVMASGRLGPLRPDQAEGLAKIVEQSQVLVRIINQLLDVRAFSKGDQRPEPSNCSFPDILKGELDALRPLFSEKGIALVLQIPEEEVKVVARKEDLAKVFGHLLSNALKFTPKGGKVSVSVKSEGQRIVFQVADTGQGIPPEALRFVFQKFFHVDQSLTREHGGMGLGLAFCREAVESMGGSIRAESKGAGLGTCVTVSLPMPAAPGTASGEKSILWVDDNPNMLELVETGFSGLNRSVALKTVQGGIPALELLKTMTPDLIVLDIMMSDMDGLEVLAQLKYDPRTAVIPVLVVSGYRDAAKTAVQWGANDYCLKPFRVADVIKKIDALLFPSSEKI